jgi:acetyl-CoA C-acetyltransferase
MGSIKDKVSIIGMGCSKFGERFDASREDLVLEAVMEALEDSGLEMKDIEAFWFGSFYEQHGTSLSSILKPDFKPVTRVENNCCSGADALRNAAFGIASGEYDVVMAVGLDKLKDNGFSGNPLFNLYRDNTEPSFGGPASFSLLVPAYAKKYSVSYEDMREAMVNVSYKNHYNGSLNPKALYRKEIPLDQIRRSPMICEPYLTIMDCSGVSDGAACAVLTSTEKAKKYRNDPMYIKSAEIVASSGVGMYETSYDYTTILETEAAARVAYQKAGITNPSEQLDLVELHDCFSITEIVLYEALGLSPRGQGWRDALEGKYTLEGSLPVNVDGGLKAMGHPVGASGIRMIYESWLQFHGKAGKRQLENPRQGLAHCLGGKPWNNVSSVTVVGRDLG